jgi:outer membrane biosynthesis protein TonB
MALQRMILVSPELWEKRSQSPPPVKEIVKSKDHSYNKPTRVRLHQDPCLKTEKQKREPIPIPITENESPKTKLKRKRIIGSAPRVRVGIRN